MNRQKRRETSKNKWISRAKKIYYTYKEFYIPTKSDVKYDCNIKYNPCFRKCESVSDFLNYSKFAKSLKKVTKRYKDISNQLESKIRNRKERHNKNYEI